MVVTVRFAGDDESDTVKFLLGHREANADADLDVYSPTSPMGGALLGAKIGDTVSYELPNGRKASVELVDAVPFTG
jgi:transcription elongation factor GreA